MSRLNKICFAALALSTLAAGCAERAPRSFVQPNVIRKADATGTWYYVQTVTDAPATSSFMFVGNSSELMKIKFDIQQNVLYARRSYEQIVGSEDRYAQDPATYYGQPVAAWKIEKQFDIIRDYNSTTGEQTNKIIESEERPWNEREFMRVDWSSNLLESTDVVGLGINFIFENAATLTSAGYWESDPTKPDAFHMERAMANDPEFGTGEANYFDVTNKWVVSPSPKTICYEEGGHNECITYPSCFFSYQIDDCANQVVKVRHAFSKISPTHDYEPRNWDGRQMELFGIWDVGLNRLTYNRQYGVTNSGFKRHAARFNLWQKSFNPDGSAMPFPTRQLRTIPYYAESSNKRNIAPSGSPPVFVDDFPASLFDTGKEVVNQWNTSVKTAVSLVMGSMPQQDVFVWCHNPVKQVADANGAADPAGCKQGLQPSLDANGKPILDEQGQPMLVARQGDPRRSTIYWVNQMQSAGPLGYGPPLFDIETGETISGQAYIYGAALDTYAARSRDFVLLLLGKLSADDYVAGLDVKTFVQQFQSGKSNMAPTYAPSQVQRAANVMNFGWARGQAPEAPIRTSSYKDFMQSLKDRNAAMYAGGVFGQNNADIPQLRRNGLRGGVLEGMMVTSDTVALAGGGASDWTALSPAEKERVSPLRSSRMAQVIEERDNKLRAFGYDFAEFADEGMVQRAITLANDTSLNNDPEAIRQKLRKDIFLGVTLHEMGHNMGLRHNFRASYDAFNYFPQYWQLRTAGATDTHKYVGLNAGQVIMNGTYGGGATCTGVTPGTLRPRYIDCPGGATSVTEVTGKLPNGMSMGGGIREFQYSSIMDYGAEFNSDLMGLGKYDKAAMKFSYADQGYVEVFTDTKQDNVTQLKWAAIETFQNAFGFPSPIGLTATLEAIPYTTYPSLFTSGADGIQKRKDVAYKDVCNPNTDDPNNTNPCPIQGFLRVDSAGNPLVPYYFCSDEFAGNLTCQRFDSGADPFEQATDIVSRYENFYLLNNFKRDRYTFHTSLGYKSRIANRYFTTLREQMTWYTLLRADFADFFGASNAFYADEKGWGSFTQGVTEGFDVLGRTLMRPGAGTYTLVNATDTNDYPISYYKHTSDSTAAGLGGAGTIVNLLDGKYVNTTWDFSNCGYYWYEDCQTRIGYFIDKTIALDTLSESQAYFTGRDTSTDVRKYAIGYILPFKNQVQEKIGALLAGDYNSFAPRLDLTTPTKVKVSMPSWTRDSVPTTPGNIVDPATGFTLSLYAGVYGLSSFPTTFDHSFIETTKIFVIGNGESSVPDTTILAVGTTTPSQTKGQGGASDWFIFNDTETGKQYAAHSTPAVADGQGGTYRNDTAVRMLEQLFAIQSAADTACGGPAPADNGSTQCAAKRSAVVQFRENIDVMRSLHHRFGYGVYRTDAPFIY